MLTVRASSATMVTVRGPSWLARGGQRRVAGGVDLHQVVVAPLEAVDRLRFPGGSGHRVGFRHPAWQSGANAQRAMRRDRGHREATVGAALRVNIVLPPVAVLRQG